MDNTHGSVNCTPASTAPLQRLHATVASVVAWTQVSTRVELPPPHAAEHGDHAPTLTVYRAAGQLGRAHEREVESTWGRTNTHETTTSLEAKVQPRHQRRSWGHIHADTTASPEAKVEGGHIHARDNRGTRAKGGGAAEARAAKNRARCFN